MCIQINWTSQNAGREAPPGADLRGPPQPFLSHERGIPLVASASHKIARSLGKKTLPSSPSPIQPSHPLPRKLLLIFNSGLGVCWCYNVFRGGVTIPYIICNLNIFATCDRSSWARRKGVNKTDDRPHLPKKILKFLPQPTPSQKLFRQPLEKLSRFSLFSIQFRQHDRGMESSEHSVIYIIY